jgi:hypothetical protein
MKALYLLLFLAPLYAQNPASNPSFDDEFSGAELNLSKWIPHDPRAAVLSPEAVIVSGGQLHLSGTVSTFGLFAQTYGRFEIRVRASVGSEFVLEPVPNGTLPRIDVFRITGTDKVFLGNRWGSEQTERSFGDSLTVPGVLKDFHTIVLDWDRDRIAWFIDGKKTFESTDGVPRQPMYLVIRHAADIDYVRVYNRQQ